MTPDRPTVHKLRAAAREHQAAFEAGFGALLRRAAKISADGPLSLDNAIQDETFDEAVLPVLRRAWRRSLGAIALEQAWEFGFQTGLPEQPDAEEC